LLRLYFDSSVIVKRYVSEPDRKLINAAIKVGLKAINIKDENKVKELISGK
jgi:predicted nucleic acid-binding protein